DRSYTDQGTLLSRDQPKAVITELSLVVEQSLNIVQKGRVISSNNGDIPIVADTLCVHGDTKNALELLMALRTAFENHGIRVKAFSQ
ncbi:MAG: LamB/YcsF family protein, partial [Flavicella sp.]|nr:LamB/YcsF family protein [Flavicella sp.]